MERACEDRESYVDVDDDCNQQTLSSDDQGQLQTRERPLTCGHCGKVFQCQQDLVPHMFTHTAENSYPCDFCDRTFKKNSYLNKHIRTHTGETPFSCEYCDKKFTQSGHLRSHLRTHLQPMNFRCEVCDRCFNYKVSLTRHMWTHDKSRGTPYVCDVCGKNFQQKSHLDEHYRRHTGEKPFHCDVCGKHFTAKGNVVTHKAKFHTDINGEQVTNQPSKLSKTLSVEKDVHQKYTGKAEATYSGISQGDVTPKKQNKKQIKGCRRKGKISTQKQPLVAVPTPGLSTIKESSEMDEEDLGRPVHEIQVQPFQDTTRTAACRDSPPVALTNRTSAVSQDVPSHDDSNESSDVRGREDYDVPTEEDVNQRETILKGEITHDNQIGTSTSGREAISEASRALGNCSNCDTCKKALNLISPFLTKIKFNDRPLSTYLKKE